MKRFLIVVDMQNDFIDGSLGTNEAQAIVADVKAKIRRYYDMGYKIIFTRDTHDADYYLNTQEGKKLPVLHCIKGTFGHEIADGLYIDGASVIDKPNFGSLKLARSIASGKFGKVNDIEEIELCGLCTDICVISNAILLKTQLPEVKIIVDAGCCAGVTPEKHQAALETMRSLQISLINTTPDAIVERI